MLFCGIFISILNHINDSRSWRIRWGEKNPKQFAAFSAIAWRLCLRSSRALSAATMAESSSPSAGNLGHSSLTVPSPLQLYQADNGGRALLTAAKSSKQSCKQNCLRTLSFGVAGFKNCVCMFAKNCFYLIQYIAYCNRKNA